ncbi:hypothetical protein BN1708_007883 [Verticillium longisporum]|uniref:Uncharacterized protein n=1 Tax=Verticillium longisporum TaxID=100787 RepID=A0A0G4MXE7_VERLO|nr:hypothetical protein BN1708_007883 [Verticillium longisporum]
MHASDHMRNRQLAKSLGELEHLGGWPLSHLVEVNHARTRSTLGMSRMQTPNCECPSDRERRTACHASWTGSYIRPSIFPASIEMQRWEDRRLGSLPAVGPSEPGRGAVREISSQGHTAITSVPEAYDDSWEEE